MAVAQTKAAAFIQERTEEISSHQIISLLMDGALERIGQALQAHLKNNQADLEILTNKLIAIINGLRNSLNMNAGEIALNLDALYEYMVEKITGASQDELPAALVEVRGLIGEIKTGWDQMDFSALPSVAEASAE
jgi:flagellar biosynthetic protein FliS